MTDAPSRPRALRWLSWLLGGLTLITTVVAGIVLLAVPVMQVRLVVNRYQRTLEEWVNYGKGASSERACSEVRASIQQLGGEEKAAHKLSLYLHMPGMFAAHRLAAGGLLGSCGRASVPYLVRLVDDEEPAVRQSATMSLGTMTDDPRAVAGLDSCLISKDIVVKILAIKALARVKPPYMNNRLDALLQDENARVREAAAEVLKGNPTVAPGLVPGSSVPKPGIPGADTDLKGGNEAEKKEPKGNGK